MKQQQEFFYGPVELRPPHMVDAGLVARCPNMKEAIRLCIHLSGRTQENVADHLEISRGQFSRIMSSQAHFPDNKLPDLFSLCGNYAPLQWLAMRCGFGLERDQKQARIRELQAELERLKA